MGEVIKLFACIGIAAVATGIYLCAEAIWYKIKYWRKHRTKIKCLCKPHVYEAYWIWSDSEMQVKCKKCGKQKRIHIDKKSFDEWFGKKGEQR